MGFDRRACCFVVNIRHAHSSAPLKLRRGGAPMRLVATCVVSFRHEACKLQVKITLQLYVVECVAKRDASKPNLLQPDTKYPQGPQPLHPDADAASHSHLDSRVGCTP